eukprot:2635595-Pleurochrysis_carterae.AAC.1
MPNWASWTVGCVDPMQPRPAPRRGAWPPRSPAPHRPQPPRSAPRLRGMAGEENIALARLLAGPAIGRARSQ